MLKYFLSKPIYLKNIHFNNLQQSYVYVYAYVSNAAR